MYEDSFSRFLHYKIHQEWVYNAWSWLIGVDMKTQDEFDDRYYEHEDWLKECWEWSPDSIKTKSTYSMGNCNECEHLIFDGFIDCVKHVNIQDEFYRNWVSLTPTIDKEINNLTCNLFSPLDDFSSSPIR